MTNTDENTKNKKALVTVREWFVAPDGSSYKAIYGTVTKQENGQLQIGNTTVAIKDSITIIYSDTCNLTAHVVDWRASKIYYADNIEELK